MSKCALCGSKAVISKQDNASRTIYNCDLCGVYVVSDLAERELEQYAPEVAAFMMSRKLMKANDIVMISFDNANKDKDYIQLTVKQIIERFPQNFYDLTCLTLRNLIHLSAFAGDEVKVDRLEMAPLFYVRRKNYEALSYIIKSMQKSELVEVNYYGTSFFPCGMIVTPKGWDRYDEFMQSGGKCRTTFVAVERREDAWIEPFRKAVRDAVKHSGLELIEGASATADDHVNYELIANVKRSSFVVCDLTNGAAEAYYAAGIAQAMGKTVALTCHESGRRNLKVDAEQMSVLFWDAREKLYTDIRNMICAFVQ